MTQAYTQTCTPSCGIQVEVNDDRAPLLCFCYGGQLENQIVYLTHNLTFKFLNLKSFIENDVYFC